jgi:hypothetical protein
VTPATDLALILRTLSPRLAEGLWMFCQARELPASPTCTPLMSFREPEGLTLIVAQAEAERLGLQRSGPYRQIILTVHTSLDAVGVTAAVSAALAREGISCNVVAAFHHDHLFVRDADARHALDTLERLSAESRPAP